MIRNRRLLGAAITGTAALVGAGIWIASVAGDTERIRAWVREEFPNVRHISTEALRERLDRGDVPVLIDVREVEEYAVSRLPTARRVDPSADAEELSYLGKDREIVVYCSVGYRSSRLAERLQEAGYTNVRNLEGSIFAWAEKGYPLVQGEHRVRKVHPYGRAWAWLVPEDLRAYTPAAALSDAGATE